MKIRRSVKIYLFCAMILMGIITIASLTTISGSYYIDGMDRAIRYAMIDIAKNTDMAERKQANVLGYNLYSNWEDIPSAISENVERPQSSSQLNKWSDTWPFWFTPPNKVIIIARYDTPKNKTIYITRVFNDIKNDKTMEKPMFYRQLICIGFIGITLFVIMLFFIFHRIAKPMERMLDWTKSLNKENLQDDIPDFRYTELNTLAELIIASMTTVQDSLKREQQFLSYASHELRTPIAVVRSNSELMKKMIALPNTQDKQESALNRIQRAGLTMTDLCETLLWLNRRTNEKLPIQSLELDKLVSQIAHELDYLSKDKPVHVDIITTPYTCLCAKTLARIVISNLIRNAFQHTHCGHVLIKQQGSELEIVNHNQSELSKEAELGFGLGLELAERIIRQQQWSYQVQKHPQGRSIWLDFSQQTAPNRSINQPNRDRDQM